MTSERDEFFYHEALVHPVAMVHPFPERALILGGGDGGAAEELLKHGSVEHVTLVDLDAEVIEVARRELTSIHRGALDDPRVRILSEDGEPVRLHDRRQLRPGATWTSPIPRRRPARCTPRPSWRGSSASWRRAARW